MKNLKLVAIAAIAVFSTQILAAKLMTPAVVDTQIEVVEEDFLEIDVTTLPQLVKDAVAKDHEGATISKAFVNKEGTYKLVLQKGDEDASVVYANSKGEWLTVE